MYRRIGVERAIMTTVHAYRSSQRMLDGPAKGFAHGLASVANLVQMFRGVAQTTTKAVPGLGGRFDGEAIGPQWRSARSQASSSPLGS
jgi:glyceraldehyde 3-phosphate dehydrogenase